MIPPPLPKHRKRDAAGFYGSIDFHGAPPEGKDGGSGDLSDFSLEHDDDNIHFHLIPGEGAHTEDLQKESLNLDPLKVK